MTCDVNLVIVHLTLNVTLTFCQSASLSLVSTISHYLKTSDSSVMIPTRDDSGDYGDGDRGDDDGGDCDY